MSAAAIVATIPSERQAGTSYDITRDRAGALACSCPAFSHSTDTPPWCKHLAQFDIAGLSSADAIPLHTFTGRQIFPLAPRLEDIALEDIAHGLSLLCRFGGQLRSFYSVAEHSVRVSQLCDPADALHGLLHDASEAYLVDIPRPLKHLPVMDPYRRAEAVLQAAIYRRFALRRGTPASVTRADEAIAVNEGQDLFAIVPAWAAAGTRVNKLETLAGWTPLQAERLFLARYHALRRRARAWVDSST